MKKDIQRSAEKFTFYSQLGWWARWQLRQYLKWICQDATSLEFLLDLEKDLQKKSLPGRKLFTIFMNAAVWYNREDHVNRYVLVRIDPEKRSSMMQIVAIFLEKGDELNHSYRGLIVDILDAGDQFTSQPGIGFGVTAEQFRLEAAEVISDLCQKWGDWHPYTSKNEPWRNWSNWYPYINGEAVQMLGCLEEIGRRLNAEQFTTVCHGMAQEIGVKTTATLLAMSADFNEFVRTYERVLVQLRWWDSHYEILLPHPKNVAELNENLTFLERLTNDPQIIAYLHYTPTKKADWKINQLLLANIKSACWNQAWRRISEYDAVKEGMLHNVEEDVVREQLRIIWQNLYESKYLRNPPRQNSKIHWEFDSFTDYIPYEERNQDWTVDCERTRRYWNWQHAEHVELLRFFDTLKPKLCSLFRALSMSENKILFGLLPACLSVEKFPKVVNVPIAWNRSVETHEGYDKYAGNYSETVEVARPKEFEGHIFTFERPDLKNAIELLENMDRVHEAIQACKNS
jgi:hypothetical protein